MPTHTITEADVSALRERKSSTAVRITLLAFAVFLLVAGAINIHLASRFAEMDGTTTMEVVREWFVGVDSTKVYSGAYIIATTRWVTGITLFALAGFFVMIWVFARRNARRDARILKFIEEKSI